MANLKYGYVPFYSALLNMQMFKGQKAQTSHVLVYGLIMQYHTFGDKGCFASNEHIAEALAISDSHVAKIISQLKAAGWINTEIDKKSNVRLITPTKVVEVGSLYHQEHQLLSPEIPAVVTGDTSLTVPENKANNKYKNKSIKDIGKPISKKFSEDDVDMVNLLFELMHQNSPDLAMKEPRDIDYEEMRKMREIDKRDLQHIKGLIIWSQQNDFWWKNIRSVHKLRKQFETLYVQAHSDFKQKQRNTIVEV